MNASSGRVVATSFLYLTVCGWIAGDVPICLKFAPQMTHPVRKRRFRQISLNSASAVRASGKSIITNRKSTLRFPSSHRLNLCVTPKSPKRWLKTTIFAFGVAFHIFVAGNRRPSNLVCRLIIASPSYGRQTVPEMGVVTSRDPVNIPQE